MTQGHIANTFIRAPDTRLHRQLRQIRVLPSSLTNSNWTTLSTRRVLPIRWLAGGTAVILSSTDLQARPKVVPSLVRQ